MEPFWDNLILPGSRLPAFVLQVLPRVGNFRKPTPGVAASRPCAYTDVFPGCRKSPGDSCPVIPVELVRSAAVMTMDKSLKVRLGLARARSVLNRAERIQRLKTADRWQEGDSPFGLAKVRVYKLAIEEEEEEGRRGRRRGSRGGRGSGCRCGCPRCCQERARQERRRQEGRRQGKRRQEVAKVRAPAGRGLG